MSTIKSNSVLNRFATTENIMNYNSNIKRIFSKYLKEQTNYLRKIQLINDNIDFKYYDDDYFNSCEYDYNSEKLLTTNGYEFIQENNYIYSEYNCVADFEHNNEIKEPFYRGHNLFEYFNGSSIQNLNFIAEENVIVFYDKNRRELIFELTYDDSIEVIDFLLLENDFVFLYLLYDGKYYGVLSHLSLNFASDNLKFEDIECYYKIHLSNNNLGRIINFSSNTILFLDDDLNKYKITLGRKYFMYKDNDIYFNRFKNKYSELSYIIKESNIQLEHLFLYDLASLFGLNEYTNTDDSKVINSNLYNKKSDMFNFRFDSTANGIINFLDLGKEKGYKIDCNDNLVSIKGNLFFDNIEETNYSLHIESLNPRNSLANTLDLSVYLFNTTTKELIKSIIVSTYGTTFYFCNLKIDVKGIFSNSIFIERELNVLDLPISSDISEENIDISFNDDYRSTEEHLHDQRIINDYNNVLSPLEFDRKVDLFATKPFIFEDGNNFDIKRVELDLRDKGSFFDKLKFETFNNLYSVYDEVESVDLGITSDLQIEELLKIERLKFNLNIQHTIV